MDLLLQKHSWLLSGLALILGASLAARTANALIATALASRPFLQQSNASTTIGDRAQPVELDAEKAARLFDVPLPKTAPDDADPSRKSGGNGEWNEIPIRSSVHALLIGTAIADPARYSLCQITSPDLYEKLGIQNGDVIRRINGYEMNSPDRALEIYQKLRDASRIEIDLERRGESLRNSYSIE